MAMTGLYWSFDWYRTGYKYILGIENQQQKRLKERKGLKEKGLNKGKGLKEKGLKKGLSKGKGGNIEIKTDLKMSDFVKKANDIFPYKGDLSVFIRNRKGKKSVSIRKVLNSSVLTNVINRASLDGKTGQIKNVTKFEESGFRQKIYILTYQLHTGSFFGFTSKIIYSIASIFGMILPITGIMMWVRKNKRKRKAKYL